MKNYISIKTSYQLALLFSTAVMILLYGKIQYHNDLFISWDLHSYMKMAASFPNLAEDVGRPFAYRLLGPYLAGSLGGNIENNFYMLTVLFALILPLLLFKAFRVAGISEYSSFLVSVLFIFNKYFFGYNVWDFFRLNDLIGLILALALYIALVKNKWWHFGGWLLLGAITREPTMLLIPLAFVYLWEKGALRTCFKSFAIASLPAITVLVLVRLSIPVSGGNTLFDAILTSWSKFYDPYLLGRLLINSFVPFVLIPLLFIRTVIEFFAKRLHLLGYFLLVFLSTGFGSNNERLMAPAFIVFYMLLAYILDKHPISKRGNICLLLIGFIVSFHHLYGIWSLPNIYWTYGFTLIGTTLATLIYYNSTKKVHI